MKIFSFIKWQWNKFEPWQKVWLVGAFFFGVGISAPHPYDKYILIVPLTIFIAYTFKWWIWDPAKSSWENFQKEQQDLFEKIKNSDKA